MRSLLVSLSLLAACSVPAGDQADAGAPDGGPALLAGFTPPAPGPGELELVSPIIHGIAAGADVTLCSYLPPDTEFATAQDIVEAHGYQSAVGSHHALLLLATRNRPVDTHPCTDDDMTNTRFLAGAGGGDAGGAALDIPAGIGFRVDAGRQLMIQTHWINATDAPIDGQVAFIVRAQAPSPSVQPAQLLNWGSTQISLGPNAAGTAHGECPVGADLHVFVVGGHAHQWGTHVTLGLRAAGAATATPFYDQTWTPHDTFDPPRLTYPIATPMELHAGDTLTADCSYYNSTSSPIIFPTEMCVGFAFFFPGDTELDCFDGAWPG
jgi:hypothetical protein